MKIETVHHRGQDAQRFVEEFDYAVIRITDGAVGGELLGIRPNFEAARELAVAEKTQSPFCRVAIFRAAAVYEAISKEAVDVC